MTTTEKEVKQSIQNILRNIEKNLKWVSCPSCKEEWTKLRLCNFFHEIDGKNRHVSDSSCVECAETFKNVEYWMRKYPIVAPLSNWPPTPTIEKKWSLPIRYGNQIILSNLSLYIVYSPVSKLWRLDTRGSGSGITMKENDDIVTRHETFPEAWSYIKKRINDSFSDKETRIKAVYSKI